MGSIASRPSADRNTTGTSLKRMPKTSSESIWTPISPVERAHAIDRRHARIVPANRQARGRPAMRALRLDLRGQERGSPSSRGSSDPFRSTSGPTGHVADRAGAFHLQVRGFQVRSRSVRADRSAARNPPSRPRRKSPAIAIFEPSGASCARSFRSRASAPRFHSSPVAAGMHQRSRADRPTRDPWEPANG